MIQVSDTVYSAIQAGAKFIEYATITLADGTVFNLTPADFTITNNHIVDGAGESVLPLGATIEKIVQLEIVNPNERYNEYDFQGAVIELTLATTIGTSVEDLPHGTYTVVEPAHYGDSVIITAVDDMYKADQLIAGTITFPITLGSLASALCTACGITLASSTFTNSTNQVNSFAGDYHEYTYRQLFGFIAQFAGGNVRINYDNELEFISYPFASLSAMNSNISQDLSIVSEGFPLTITFGEDPLTFQDMSAVLYSVVGTSITTIKTWTWSTLQSYIDGYSLTIPSDSTIEAITTIPVIMEVKWLSAYDGVWYTYRILLPILDRTDNQIEVLDKWRTVRVETDDIEITGIQTDLMSAQLADSDDSGYDTVLVGNEGYVLTVSNPFINASNYSTKLASILSLFNGFKIRPFSGEHVSNPIIEFMDPVYIVTKYSKVYISVITDIQYNVLGHTAISNSAEPKLRTGKVYSSQSNNAYLRAVENTDKRVKRVNNYFWHDAAGAHVSTVENDATQGPNVLMDSNGTNIRDGEDTVASYGRTTVLGKDGGSQLALSPTQLAFYNDANENVGKMTFGGSQTETKIWTHNGQNINTATYDVTPPALTIGTTVTLYVQYSNGTDRATNTFTFTLSTSQAFIGGTEGDALYTLTFYYNSQIHRLHFAEETHYTGSNYYIRMEYVGTDTNPIAFQFGDGAVASAEGSCAIGTDTIASKQDAHAEGNNTEASEVAAHAEGSSTTAEAVAAHAEGANTNAAEECAHAEGDSTLASGYASHAEGSETSATEDYSHAQNLGTWAASEAQTAMGKYNEVDSSDEYALIIGNGSDENNRSNALTVDWGGNLKCNNIGAVISGKNSSQIAVATSTYTTIASVELSAGTWIIIGECQFTSNSTGVRRLSILASTATDTWQVSYGAGSEQMKIQITKILEVSSITTYNLRAWQNSGSSLNCGANNGTLTAVRIK